MSTQHLDRVVRLYDATQLGYDCFWPHDYLRYGFCDDKTRSLAESLANVDRVVAEERRLGPDDVVLHAGCGVGGLSLSLGLSPCAGLS
jgi:tocopherol O-methyltransferase